MRLLPLRGLPDEAHPDPGRAQVRRRLDVGDGHEPDPRILDVLRQDRPDLLPQQLIDPISPCRHSMLLMLIPVSPMPVEEAKAPPRTGASALERA